MDGEIVEKKSFFKNLDKTGKSILAVVGVFASLMICIGIGLTVYYVLLPPLTGDDIETPTESSIPIDTGPCKSRFCHAAESVHNYLLMVMKNTRLQYFAQNTNYQVDAIGSGVSYNMVGLRQVENQCDVFKIFPIGYRSEFAIMKENSHDLGTFYLAMTSEVDKDNEAYTHFKLEFDTSTNKYAIYNVGTNSYIELKEDILSVGPYFNTTEDSTTKYNIFQCLSCDECTE